MNSLINLEGLWSGIRIGGGALSQNNVAYNNLWYNCSLAAHSNIIISHSWYYNTDRRNDSTNVQIELNNPFVDIANEDFRLSSATLKGEDTLGSPYNVDLYGITRGTDGVWDRGAYEFDSGISRPEAPSGLTIAGY